MMGQLPLETPEKMSLTSPSGTPSKSRQILFSAARVCRQCALADKSLATQTPQSSHFPGRAFPGRNPVWVVPNADFEPYRNSFRILRLALQSTGQAGVRTAALSGPADPGVHTRCVVMNETVRVRVSL